MGIFKRFFGRGGGEEPQEPQQPEQTPAPAPEAGPAAGDGGGGGKKRGFLGRIFGGRKKKAPKGEAPPAPPEAPPAPPTGPPPPPAPPTPAEGPEEGPEGGEEGEEAPEKDYSDAPSSASIRIAGTWMMSRRKWVGVVKGTLTGSAVVEFLKALDEGRDQDAVMMVCEEFDDGSGFASAVNLDESTWETPVW
ncbi:hypothetical protein [Streptomyces sp. C10-9-1]|uniref:hypothetical protein n=1 Tax=Streptomyces sp. C10-9-1 TaxID=1859285 RepID=UPI003F49C61A